MTWGERQDNWNYMLNIMYVEEEEEEGVPL